MNSSSKRPLQSVRSEWSIPQLRNALAAALDGTGPALSLSPTDLDEVDQKVALLLSTTGSTGSPKTISLSASAIITSARISHSFLGASSSDRWSLKLPTTHIAGINVIARSIALGSELLDSAGEFTAIVPTQLHRALNGDLDLLHELQGCKAVLVGGAATSLDLLAQARAANINVVTTYGSTETTGGCVYNNEPLSGVEVRINQAGLIEIASPTLAEGVATNGWYTTSDLGEIVSGKLNVLGRADDVIISGGENISLGRVEAALSPLGLEVVAIGAPSTEWGQELVLLSTQVLDESQVRDLLSAAIGKFALPKKFALLSEIPLKGIGKVDRARALELFLAINKPH